MVERLADLGIIPRGTGADNIRNITASPTAGIDAQELADTRPLVRALHHHILNTRDLFALPRKFNISVAGGGAVEVLEETNDISLRAVLAPDGLRYRLTLGGITGHRDFARPTGVAVRPQDAVRVCDAILRVFIAEGDRTDRKAARLKYVLDRLGAEGFLARVEQLLGQALDRVEEAALRHAPPPAKHGHLGIHAQRQAGLNYIGLVTPVGRLGLAQLRGIADLARRLGSGTIRLTVWQNLLVSDIPDARLEEACAAIAALGLGWQASNLRGGLVPARAMRAASLAASDTKRHAAALAEFLDARIAVDAPVNIHLTGCHHSCAQHYIADIGLLGAKVERGEELVEGYDLHVGGGAGPEQKIGRLVVPKLAQDLLGPAVLALLQGWMRDRRPGEGFQSFTGATTTPRCAPWRRPGRHERDSSPWPAAGAGALIRERALRRRPQRAWLNASWPGSMAGPRRRAMPPPRAAARGPAEEFPWHTPALELEERCGSPRGGRCRGG